MIPKITWPDNVGEVECVGFSQPIIYDLIVAIDHGRVEYVSKDMNGWYYTYVFDFLGFRYSLEVERLEDDFVPYRLSKIARLAVDDDGNPIIDEEFPITKAKPLVPKYDGVWGSF